LGLLLIESISYSDYPLVVAIMLFFGAGMAIVNLLVDITYSLFDPRIRYN